MDDIVEHIKRQLVYLKDVGMKDITFDVSTQLKKHKREELIAYLSDNLGKEYTIYPSRDSCIRVFVN